MSTTPFDESKIARERTGRFATHTRAEAPDVSLTTDPEAVFDDALTRSGLPGNFLPIEDGQTLYDEGDLSLEVRVTRYGAVVVREGSGEIETSRVTAAVAGEDRAQVMADSMVAVRRAVRGIRAVDPVLEWAAKSNEGVEYMPHLGLLRTSDRVYEVTAPMEASDVGSHGPVRFCVDRNHYVYAATADGTRTVSRVGTMRPLPDDEADLLLWRINDAFGREDLIGTLHDTAKDLDS